MPRFSGVAPTMPTPLARKTRAWTREDRRETKTRDVSLGKRTSVMGKSIRLAHFCCTTFISPCAASTAAGSLAILE